MHKNYEKIKKAFNRSANIYDYNCALQFSVANNLIDLIQKNKKSFDTVIDLGCGTGLITAFLKGKIACGKLYAVDISNESLGFVANRLKNDIVLESSFDDVPLSDQAIDLVFSNMSFQWSSNFEKTINESSRILKNGGFLAFSMPARNSFKEIRLAAEKLGISNFLNRLLSSEEIMDVLQEYILVDMVAINYTYYYSSILPMLKSLKNVGASHIVNNSHKRLTKLDFQTLDEYFNVNYSYGQIPLSYEIICCLAIRK